MTKIIFSTLRSVYLMPHFIIVFFHPSIVIVSVNNVTAANINISPINTVFTVLNR
jgi:hypothetical protein